MASTDGLTTRSPLASRLSAHLPGSKPGTSPKTGSIAIDCCCAQPPSDLGGIALTSAVCESGDGQAERGVCEWPWRLILCFAGRTLWISDQLKPAALYRYLVDGLAWLAITFMTSP